MDDLLIIISAMQSGQQKTRVIIGMSGGVDSSVAAWKLLRDGYAVEGLFMKNWEEDDTEEYCTAAEDLADAQAVCDQLGIPLHTVNFSADYWDRVFEYFLAEYRAGRTPNPDVMCNKEIKFKAFLDHALKLGADRIATGHYARIVEAGGVWRLLKGRDTNKDQSYFLCALGQHQLRHALFPLGDMEKREVREIAATQGFVNSAKKDSTGICFIGERKFRDFLQRFIPAQPGNIVTDSGEVIGHHNGLMFYTLGQRQGLGIGGVKNASEAPWFVAQKRLDTNELVVVQGHDHPLLLRRTLQASQLNWIEGKPPATTRLRCSAKIRYRQADQPCEVTLLDEGRCEVVFDAPQRAITPGQALVLYDGEACIAGAVID